MNSRMESCAGISDELLRSLVFIDYLAADIVFFQLQSFASSFIWIIAFLSMRYISAVASAIYT